MPEIEGDVPINVHTPLRIEFTYWNFVPETVLNVSMTLNNAEEVCVFNSFSDFVARPCGIIRHTVTIPGDLLNAGSYYVNMMIVKDASVGILFQNNIVGFEVVEGEVVSNWYGRQPGATRPKLRWKSDVIESTGCAAGGRPQHLT
jgi:lipopolysaccharide transport system ATP-binding protein